MAGLAIPAPGTEFGPCEGPCEHRDCRATRAWAAETCPGCGQEPGYERTVTRPPAGDPLDRGGAFWHQTCLLEAAEREEGG